MALAVCFWEYIWREILGLLLFSFCPDQWQYFSKHTSRVDASFLVAREEDDIISVHNAGNSWSVDAGFDSMDILLMKFMIWAYIMNECESLWLFTSVLAKYENFISRNHIATKLPLCNRPISDSILYEKHNNPTPLQKICYLNICQKSILYIILSIANGIHKSEVFNFWWKMKYEIKGKIYAN